MKEKVGDFDTVMEMLRVQYGDAKIEVFNSELTEGEPFFYREKIENLLLKIAAPVHEGYLELDRVVLGRDFKPLVYEWKFLTKGKKTEVMVEEGGELSYQYIVAGKHSENLSSLETVVFEFKTATDGTEMVYYAEIISEFDKKNNAWEVKGGRLRGSNDEILKYAVDCLGLAVEDGNEEAEVDEAIIEYLGNLSIYGIDALVIMAYNRPEIKDEIVFENEKMMVTLYESEPDEFSNTDRVHTVWVKV